MEGVDYLRHPTAENTVNFRLGLNTDWVSDSLRPGQCKKLENLDIAPRGVLSARKGIRRAAFLGPATTKVLDMHPYYQSPSGATFLCHMHGNGVYSVNLGTGVAVFLGNTVSSRFQWLTWNNKAYGFGGAVNGAGEGVIYRWDGTAFSQVSGPTVPALTCGAVNLDRIWGFAGDSKLYYSDSLDGDTWDKDINFLRVRDNDGDTGKGVIRVAGNRILALKSTSAWLVDGSEIYDFSKMMETDSIGLLGDTLKPYDETAVWLSGRGLCYWNPALPKGFHVVSRDSVNDEILNNTKAVLEDAGGHFAQKTERYYLTINAPNNPQVYVFFFKFMYTDERGNVRVPCTKYLYKTYSADTSVGPVVSMNGGNDSGELYMGSGDTGDLFQIDYGDSDDGDKISIDMETADLSFGLIERKGLRRIDQKVKCGSALSAELSVDFKPYAFLKTLESTGSGPKFGSFKFGEKKFGGLRVGTGVLKYLKAGFDNISYRVYGDVSGNTEIRYPTFHYYPKSILAPRR